MAKTTDLLQGTLDLLILKTLLLGSLHGWGISKRLREMSRDVGPVGERQALRIGIPARNAHCRPGGKRGIQHPPGSSRRNAGLKKCPARGHSALL